jgi:putative transport protein
MSAPILAHLLAEQMLVLFAILALGSWLGHLSIRRFSLGPAGVFFVALLFGHFGLTVPRAIMDLGLLLFVYAVGLQAGPSFFRTFRKQGSRFVVIAAVAVLAAGLATVAVARLLRLPAPLAVGLFTGAVTNTPALAAAIDAVAQVMPSGADLVAVGYGVAYPFSIIGVTLFVQVLPRLLRRSVPEAEAQWLEQQSREQPALLVKRFRVTNPNFEGMRLADVNAHRISLANISRVCHQDQEVAGTPGVILHLGDVVTAVGSAEELEKMRLLLGEETAAPSPAPTHVAPADMEVTEKALAGKRLVDLHVSEQYGVVITRIRRQGLEITPFGSSTLEMGDSLRVVGERSAVEEFGKLVGGDQRKADETSMVPFLMGLLLGILLGSIPFRFPNGMVVKLGIAGGAFVVSLLVGHFGRIGPFRLYVPAAARNLARELGLMLFLAGAGAFAGAQLAEVVQQQGVQLFAAGAVITVVAVAAALLLTDRVYRLNLLASMGLLTGCMTNPPALDAAGAQTRTDLPTISYASIYPVVLIFKILLAQILVEILRQF